MQDCLRFLFITITLSLTVDQQDDGHFANLCEYSRLGALPSVPLSWTFSPDCARFIFVFLVLPMLIMTIFLAARLAWVACEN